MRTFTPETAVAGFELEQFVEDYWREVDFNDARNIADYFTEDCLYDSGPGIRYQTREGMRKFYDHVRSIAQPDRYVRHTILSKHVDVKDKNAGTVNYCIVTYIGFGKTPIQGVINPSQITDVRIECRRNKAGKWEIAEFHGNPLFAGGGSQLKELGKK
jgi:hypothetical protein